jgi:hypothetical protein
MRCKFLYALFLLFPLACQAEITKEYLKSKILDIEEDLSYHARHSYNDPEKWNSYFWYNLGKRDAYQELLKLEREFDFKCDLVDLEILKGSKTN